MGWERITYVGLIVTSVELLGVFTAVQAIMTARTSQGAIAWAISLVLFPFFALPAYWVFGRNKFLGYLRARRAGNLGIAHIVDGIAESMPEFRADVASDDNHLQVFERLAGLPFTRFNDAKLLIDGQAAFDAIFQAIESAQNYILVQFFIVRDDEVGRILKELLLRKAKEGVRVYFLFDQVGSHSLRRAYVNELAAAERIEILAFRSTIGWRNRLQLNFRNHRKTVIVDGRVGFVGGLNVGDEYMGKSEEFGPWRDTHVQVVGPTVQEIQLSFLEDWFWATQSVPELEWSIEKSPVGDRRALVLATGPADDFEACSMFFVEAINAARKRLWIASPYFVPDAPVIAALQLAAIRGVDVRVMLPAKADHAMVYLAGYSFVAETEPAGVKIYRYKAGFLHQKVMLVDDELATVGTANLDNRSFRLNFEITVAFADHEFAQEVAAMLERDFENSRLTTSDELERRSVIFRFLVRVARLFAPVL